MQLSFQQNHIRLNILFFAQYMLLIRERLYSHPALFFISKAWKIIMPLLGFRTYIFNYGWLTIIYTVFSYYLSQFIWLEKASLSDLSLSLFFFAMLFASPLHCIEISTPFLYFPLFSIYFLLHQHLQLSSQESVKGTIPEW